MIISTKRGTLDLANHIDSQYIEHVLSLGSWYVTPSGYIVHMCKSAKKLLHLHRYVYELANGPIPEGLQIDHIDGNRRNNFLSNLRVVTNQQNHFNRTKAKGCHFKKATGKWMAYIKFNGELKYLGCYNTEAEAHQAYLDAKKIHHII